jgi:hypothetical protein
LLQAFYLEDADVRRVICCISSYKVDCYVKVIEYDYSSEKVVSK